MSVTQPHSLFVALVTTVVLSLGSVVCAEENPVVREDNGTQRQVLKPQVNDLGRLDSATSGATVRASEMIGMNVHNAQGETIAEINDLVLDPKQGKIRYAAVTYGGFLGMGDKMFAVPFNAFHCQSDPNDADEQILFLNVNEKTLENAKGFDQDNWPDFGDKSFTSQLDQRYGVNRQNRMENQRNRRNGRVDVDVNRRGADVEVNRE